VRVVGGNGAKSGLTAVIAGAPVVDTADGGEPRYVSFPSQLVLTARC
jgi:hypothetical protein